MSVTYNELALAIVGFLVFVVVLLVCLNFINRPKY